MIMGAHVGVRHSCAKKRAAMMSGVCMRHTWPRSVCVFEKIGLGDKRCACNYGCACRCAAQLCEKACNNDVRRVYMPHLATVCVCLRRSGWVIKGACL